MGRGRPMIGTPAEAADRKRAQSAERMRRMRERRRAEVTVPLEPTPAVPPAEVTHAAQTKVQNIAAIRLRMFVERIERLEEELSELGGLGRRNPALASAYARERASLQEDVKEVYAEAKGTGFDPAVLKEVIRIRKMGEEQRWALPLYLEALEP